MSDITILVPFFNEEKNLKILYSEIVKSIKSFNFKFELLFVDDGSTDNSLTVIKNLSKNKINKKIIVRCISLSRNFGKEASIQIGLQKAQCNKYLILLDSDLQHPPSYIKSFIKKMSDPKIDIVVGIRKSYDQGIFRKVTSKIFYKIISILSEIKLEEGSTDYSMISKKVINSINKLNHGGFYYKALLSYVGFNKTYVYFDAPKRIHGSSTFGVSGLIDKAVFSIIQYSKFPIKFTFYLGVILLILSIIFFATILIMKFMYNIYISNPIILLNINFIFISIILIFLGLIGLYILNLRDQISSKQNGIINE